MEADLPGRLPFPLVAMTNCSGCDMNELHLGASDISGRASSVLSCRSERVMMSDY